LFKRDFPALDKASITGDNFKDDGITVIEGGKNAFEFMETVRPFFSNLEVKVDLARGPDGAEIWGLHRMNDYKKK
jgi:hypothetical protein